MGYLDNDGLLHFWQSIKTKFATSSALTAEVSRAEAAESSKVSKTGDTMTGKLDVPAVNDVDTDAKREIATGINKDSYFQCRKFRGEGTASTYYHAVDYGYVGHDQVDFHEYGGVWNFLQNTRGKSNTGVQVGSIQSGKGWVGKVNGFDIGMSVPAGSKLTDTVYDDSALKARVTALEGREDKDTTYGPATTDAAGLMSAADKAKLDGIAEGADKSDAYTKEEVDERLDNKASLSDIEGMATYITRSDMDAALAQQGIATPLDYANAKALMANAGMFYPDDRMCVNVLAMAEVISALCAQIDAIDAKLAALDANSTAD